MTDETQPVKGTPHPQDPDQPQPPAVPEDASEQPAAAPPRRGRFTALRERTRAVRGATVAAVLAGVIVGGAAGFAVGAVTTGHDHPWDGDRGPGMGGRPFDDDGDDQGPPGFAPGGSGQVPPATVPDEELDNS